MLSCGKKNFELWPDKVYMPKSDSFFLLHSIKPEPNDIILDIGCGCGLLGVILAERVRKVYSVDINPYAVELTKRNSRLNRVSKKMMIRKSDIFSNLKNVKFDLIISNISQLPTPPGRGRRAWISHGDNGGYNGRRFIDRIILDARNYLRPKGKLLIFHYAIADLDKSRKMLTSEGFATKIISKQKLPFGRLTYERIKYIKKIGGKFFHYDPNEPFQYVYVLEAKLAKPQNSHPLSRVQPNF